jgi:RNA polymerase sigma-70 factor, ECF subfamily
MDEERFRALIEAGEPLPAFDMLYRAYRKDIAAYVRARVGAAAQADDVCQEVWAAVNKALPKFRFEAKPRVWVLSIARHKSQDAWRRHASCDTLDSQIKEGGPLASLLGVRAVETPSAVIRRKERDGGLRAALGQLRPDEIELLELRFVQGMKPAEIAQILGSNVSANTVSQRIVRVLERVRQRIAEA